MKEYKQLVQGLAKEKIIKSESEVLSHPILQKDIVKEAVPGGIRKAEHFLPMLRKIIVYLKKLMQEKTQVQMLSPLKLVYSLQEEYFID